MLRTCCITRSSTTLACSAACDFVFGDFLADAVPVIGHFQRREAILAERNRLVAPPGLAFATSQFVTQVRAHLLSPSAVGPFATVGRGFSPKTKNPLP